MDFGIETDCIAFASSFYASKAKQKNLALLIVSCAYCFHYIFSTWFFTFSFFSPLKSIVDITNIMFNNGYLLLLALILQMLLSASLGYLLTTYVFSAFYEPILNISKVENAIAFSAFFFANLLNTFLYLLTTSDIFWFKTSALGLFWFTATLFSSFVSAYFSNFSLAVDEAYLISKYLKNYEYLRSVVAFNLILKLYVTAKILTLAWLTSLFIVVMFEYFRLSAASLFAFWRFVDIVFYIYLQQCIVHISILTYNYYIAYPIFYSMPLYNLYSASVRDSKSILAGLSCNDAFIKETVLFSLRTLAVSKSTRECFYVLSIPGYHPRGWKHLLQIAVFCLNNVRAKLETATHKCKTIQQQKQSIFSNLGTPKKNSSLKISPNKLETRQIGSPVIRNMLEEKHGFFVPPSLNPRSYEYFGQSKRLSPIINSLFVPPIVYAFMAQARSKLFISDPVLSTYETKCVIFAIQAISNVVTHSLKEDRFGVVQKDLKTTISLLTSLSMTIDAYIRASKLGPNENDDRNVFALDIALAGSLKEMFLEFKPVIKELNLPSTELEIFEMLTH